MCRKFARFLDRIEDILRVSEDLVNFFQMAPRGFGEEEYHSWTMLVGDLPN